MNNCCTDTSLLASILGYVKSIGSTIASAFTFILGTTSVVRYVSSTTGTVDVGAISVSFLNVGGADAIVLGQALVAGQSLNLDAVIDPVNHVFKTLPSMTYDGTGTTLSITVMS